MVDALFVPTISCRSYNHRISTLTLEPVSSLEFNVACSSSVEDDSFHIATISATVYEEVSAVIACLLAYTCIGRRCRKKLTLPINGHRESLWTKTVHHDRITHPNCPMLRIVVATNRYFRIQIEFSVIETALRKVHMEWLNCSPYCVRRHWLA